MNDFEASTFQAEYLERQTKQAHERIDQLQAELAESGQTLKATLRLMQQLTGQLAKLQSTMKANDRQLAQSLGTETGKQLKLMSDRIRATVSSIQGDTETARSLTAEQAKFAAESLQNLLFRWVYSKGE